MTRYICTLSELERLVISMRLHRAGVTGEDWCRAMSGRVCDLEDTIDVREWRSR